MENEKLLIAGIMAATLRSMIGNWPIAHAPLNRFKMTGSNQPDFPLLSMNIQELSARRPSSVTFVPFDNVLTTLPPLGAVRSRLGAFRVVTQRTGVPVGGMLCPASELLVTVRLAAPY